MKKDKKIFPWEDCVTLLTWQQVQEYEKNEKDFILEFLNHNKESSFIKGKILHLRQLSDNAFYFHFQGKLEGVVYNIKVKQNIALPTQRYISSLD